MKKVALVQTAIRTIHHVPGIGELFVQYSALNFGHSNAKEALI